MHTCNPCMKEVEARRSIVLCLSHLHSKLKDMLSHTRLCLRKTTRSKEFTQFRILSWTEKYFGHLNAPAVEKSFSKMVCHLL